MEDQVPERKPGQHTLRAASIKSLPPWHPGRQFIKIAEVPLYLKHFYNVNVSSARVYCWAKHGVKVRGEDRRVYLKSQRMLGVWHVSKTDLQTFLSTTEA